MRPSFIQLRARLNHPLVTVVCEAGQISLRSCSLQARPNLIIGFRIMGLDDLPMLAKGRHVHLIGPIMSLFIGQTIPPSQNGKWLSVCGLRDIRGKIQYNKEL